MRTLPTRRDVMTALAGAGAATVVGARQSAADEGPLETTTVRLRVEVVPPNVVDGVVDLASCNSPEYVAEDLLRAEGFTEVRYVPRGGGSGYTQAFERNEIDFGFMFAPGVVSRLDAGAPIKVLAGMHPGCLELFAHEHVRSVADLKGRQAGINDSFGSSDHIFVSIMAAHVGLDPKKDINWVTTDDVASPKELYIQGKIDAYLAFVPEQPELRAHKAGRAIVNMGRDKPWLNYYCCILAANQDFVRQSPVATKRVLRAILKAMDLCTAEPERAARRLIAGGFARYYDRALQLGRVLNCVDQAAR
jgi:NitT/TauT family transport system substrate-binding protein